MSISTKPRIIKHHKPRKKFTENTYRNAKPYLLQDFDRRCAYSLQHVDQIGWTTMEIDHHNPFLKGAPRNHYENLFPATRHCNGSKGQTWPSREARKQGIHFLNPCLEQDYGAQIFENPTTHELVGTTPAACYHIRVLGLNAQFLINERKERASLRMLLEATPVKVRDSSLATDHLAEVRQQLEMLIPPIPAPPF